MRYSDTPVGPYDEVFGLVGSRTGRRGWGSVCFMSVDSPASLVGGRANWGMPKTLGAFAGEIASGSSVVARGADEVEWSVTATPRVRGPRLPARSRAITRQEFDGGRIGDSRLSASAKIRPALVDVEVSSEGDLATWLTPGRHLGAVVERSTFSLAPPTYSEPADPARQSLMGAARRGRGRGRSGRRRSCSRGRSTGTRAWTARVSIESTSPPLGPTDVAPTSRPSRTTSLMSPSLPGPVHVPAGRLGEVGAADLDLATLLARLLLGQAHRPDLGVGEGHPRHGAVVGLGARAGRAARG